MVKEVKPNVQDNIYTFIYDTYKKNKIPIDKFGSFFSKGGKTVEDVVSPNFTEMDFILALLLDLKEGDKKKVD